MFKILLICALAALVAANANVEVKELVNDVQADGFVSKLVLDDGSASSASGDVHGNIDGVFEWISPEGVHVRVSYKADENGYQPQSDLLPTPPPIPAAILKAIAYIQANPSKN
ncbi:larval cuticle protein 3 [Drosophila teissieri]|uniref:larval cuticle protein 3 n=1 Tax=Drosophila teissieri TaxID=7243 RepID=UPI001CB9E6EC|nr:larval cuticle protein 3 [Drosophila teissieri]XP_043662786.1 larval cuticle protein 3 [Drosophila teissieri]